MLEFEVQRCTRHCATTGRELRPGETVYSVLMHDGPRVMRLDYSTEGWSGPPSGAIGWWKSHLASPTSKRMQWAPNDVMLDLLEQTETQTDQLEFRYVLSLLLARRRVLRLEETETDSLGREVATLYAPRRETTYLVVTAMPSDERAAAIQDELAKLLVNPNK